MPARRRALAPGAAAPASAAPPWPRLLRPSSPGRAPAPGSRAPLPPAAVGSPARPFPTLPPPGCSVLSGFGFGGIISLARTSFPTFKVPRVCVAAFAPEASLVVLRWGRVLGAPPGAPWAQRTACHREPLLPSSRGHCSSCLGLPLVHGPGSPFREPRAAPPALAASLGRTRGTSAAEWAKRGSTWALEHLQPGGKPSSGRPQRPEGDPSTLIFMPLL